jgi:serine/threonine-protein kinase
MAAMEPTQAFAPSMSEVAAPDRAVELVSGSGPAMSSEIERLLRARLGAVAICLAIGTAAFLVLGISTGNLVSVPGITLLEIYLILCFSGLILLLYSRLNLSLPQLRYVEWGVFGHFGLVLAAMQTYQVSLLAKPGAPRLASALIVFVTIWHGTMYVYAVMIPSTMRRSSVVVGLLASAPVLLLLIERTQYEVVRDLVELTGIAYIATIMAIGAGISVFTAHSIGALRKEAFEARRLGQYRLKELLGSGGMGEVRLAEHLLLKRPCAIKVIRPDRATDASALARFEREVRAAAELTHPNTIAIYDYGRADDGSFYYVMEYLPGLTLAEMVERHGPLPPERVIHLLRQVCGALGEAHARGLVHRDVKPGNIIVTQRGGAFDFVKLLDFGLVKPATDNAAANQLTQENMIAGSPLYMSPEQSVASHELDGRSDLYSLGAVAYFLMTGQPPFAGLSTMEVIVAHARDAVTPPSRLNAAVPHDLEKAVLHCLEKDRNKRFQHAEDFDRALAGCELAGRWTQEQAIDWWREQAPSHRPGPTLPSMT